MRILLVDPMNSLSAGKGNGRLPGPKTVPRKPKKNDDMLRYPPLGLMKLSTFHKRRGDQVGFAVGRDSAILNTGDTLELENLWDRIYISTLFTYQFGEIVRTINYYKQAVGGTSGRIFVGGIMASLMADALYAETGIYPTLGILTSPEQIGLCGNENIDLLPPDYEILDSDVYGTNDTFYAYTTRGCVNKCAWCGVPRLEPDYNPYIDIKPTVAALRETLGDKPRLKLMDNNVLASPCLDKIIDDLVYLGYGRTQASLRGRRQLHTVDFNQGLDASFINKRTISLISRINLRPMRVAFDRIREKTTYVKAIKLAYNHGVREFSNYMLYNFKDTPRDLYDRLVVNMELNELWHAPGPQPAANIYSYPMRYAPIDSDKKEKICEEHSGDSATSSREVNWLSAPIWTRRFVRSVEIMKGAAHGAISPTPALARRTIGASFEEYLVNLYMPEELLRNRNRHERKVYQDEPERAPGSGKVEAFRNFLLPLLASQDERFHYFHQAVASNAATSIKEALLHCKDKEITKWLELYLRKHQE
jgi:hypothetical protein